MYATKGQLEGIDVVDGNMYIDEKVASHYVNSPLNTFAVEIAFKGKDGAVRDGWFVNDSLKTTHYLLGQQESRRAASMPRAS